MMLADETRQFCVAAYFILPAKGRDKTQAVRVLRHLPFKADVRIALKAAQALQDYESERASV